MPSALSNAFIGPAGPSSVVIAVATASPYAVPVNVTVVLVAPAVPVAFAVNLPAGATHVVGQVTVKDRTGMTSNPSTRITIQPDGTETIDGATSLVVDQAYASVTQVFAGTEWSQI